MSARRAAAEAIRIAKLRERVRVYERLAVDTIAYNSKVFLFDNETGQGIEKDTKEDVLEDVCDQFEE